MANLNLFNFQIQILTVIFPFYNERKIQYCIRHNKTIKTFNYESTIYIYIICNKSKQ